MSRNIYVNNSTLCQSENIQMPFLIKIVDDYAFTFLKIDNTSERHISSLFCKPMSDFVKNVRLCEESCYIWSTDSGEDSQETLWWLYERVDLNTLVSEYVLSDLSISKSNVSILGQVHDHAIVVHTPKGKVLLEPVGNMPTFLPEEISPNVLCHKIPRTWEHTKLAHVLSGCLHFSSQVESGSYEYTVEIVIGPAICNEAYKSDRNIIISTRIKERTLEATLNVFTSKV